MKDQFRYITDSKPVIVLLGEMGVGKSTIGNCLINLNASEELIRDSPFATNNNVISCTNHSSVFSGHEFVVIDTVGFGDPLYHVNTTLSLFKNALELVNYRIDLLLFVTESGRLTEQTIEFFETISQNLLIDKVMQNAIFICNKCRQGWIDIQLRERKSQEEKAATFYAVLEKFGNRTFEFNLEFPSSDDLDGIPKDEVILRNQLANQSRERSIDRLNSFLKQEISKKQNASDGGRIHMDFVKSNNFEKAFVKDLQALIDNQNWNLKQTAQIGASVLFLKYVGVALHATMSAVGVSIYPYSIPISVVFLIGVSVATHYKIGNQSPTECIMCLNLSKDKGFFSSWFG